MSLVNPIYWFKEGFTTTGRCAKCKKSTLNGNCYWQGGKWYHEECINKKELKKIGK